MVILVIMTIFILIFLFSSSNQSITGRTCNMLGEPHKWAYKDNMDGNRYLACSVCKMLPGGDMEESDDSSN